MNKAKRMVWILLSVLMLAGLLPMFGTEVEAATLSLSQLQKKYPNGYYWNHYAANVSQCGNNLQDNGDESFAESVSTTPCKNHAEAYRGACVGGYECNHFDGGIQCVGFARRLAFEAYGSRVRSWAQHSDIYSVKPGDVVHISGYDVVEHDMFVTSVSGTIVTVGEANFINDPCRISWGRTYDLRNYTTVWIYSAPWVLDGTPEPVDPVRSWDHYAEKHQVGSTNAVLAGWLNLNVDCSAISSVGIYLYDYNGKQLKTKTENISYSGFNYMSMWYDVNGELGYTLAAGTPYKYKFQAVINGETYYSPVYSFTTTGTHSHKYDSGTVTKKPTCTGTGVKTYTCTTCGGTKTESVSATGHSYANATCTVAKKCTVCGTTSGSAAGHQYTSSTITKKATCKEAGVKTYTCSVCKGTKTESISKLTTHTYDNNCDSVCNVCNGTRTVTHQFGDWSKDASGHWHACTLCGSKGDQAAHKAGAAATESTPQTCTVCGYVIKAALGHTHKHGTAWEKDASGHWRACACGDKAEYTGHNYENTCDTDCNICGFTRTITHTPGEPATATKDQVCVVCGKVLAEATGEEAQPTEPAATEPVTAPVTEDTEPETEQEEETTTAPQEESAPQTPDEPVQKDNDAMWIVLVVVAAVVPVSVVTWLQKKKK